MQFSNVKNLHPTGKTTLKILGSLTGETWMGEFEFYRVLTHRQQLEKDRIRRGFLGLHSETASPNILGRANAFADLQVRIISAPKWWEASNNGLDLVDDEVLIALYEAVIKSENEFIEERTAKVAEAKKDLKNLGPNLEDPQL